MKFFLFIAIVLLSHSLIAQTNIAIVDSATKKPISYATIECYKYKWGIFASEFGETTIPNFVVKGDTIVVSRVGYYKKQILITETLHTVFLSTRILEAVTVESCKERRVGRISIDKEENYYLGFAANKTIQESVNWFIHIPNNNNKGALIEEIKYYVYTFHKPQMLKAQVQLLLFGFDKSLKIPTTDLLNDFVIVQPNKEGWNSINLKGLNIPFPESGVVVGFGRYEVSDRFLDSTLMFDSDKKIYSYGWSIQASKFDAYNCYMHLKGQPYFGITNKGPAFQLKYSYCK